MDQREIERLILLWRSRNLTFREIAERLGEKGVKMSPGAVRNRVTGLYDSNRVKATPETIERARELSRALFDQGLSIRRVLDVLHRDHGIAVSEKTVHRFRVAHFGAGA